LVQVLNVCEDCTAKFAVELSKCPHCGSTKFTEDWQMPKITEHGGPSNATAGPGEPGYMPPGEAGTNEAEAPTADVDVPVTDGEYVLSQEAASRVAEGSEPSSPVPGMDSSTSSQKPPTSPETSEPALSKPARKTASRSSKARMGSSSAPGTAGGPTAPTSATDSDEGGEK
jgi:hypothetical protein